MDYILRREQPDGHTAVEALTREAFWGLNLETLTFGPVSVLPAFHTIPGLAF